MKRRRALGSVMAALLVFAVCLVMLPARVSASGPGMDGCGSEAADYDCRRRYDL